MSEAAVGDPGFDAPIIARARLVPPRLRPEVAERPDLVERVLDSPTRLVVVSGPAGCGKSTLLAQCCEHDPTAVWLSIGPTDDDPVVLWWAIIESIGTALTGFGSDFRDRLLLQGETAVDDIVAAVANELTRRGRPVHLIVDDAHLLQNRTCHESLRQFVRQLPPGARVSVASRDSTPFPLARLRAEGELLELSATDITLTVEQVAGIAERVGIPLGLTELELLVARTEGWPAGLRLALMAIDGAPDVSAFVTDFHGTDRDVAEYLVHEVLDRVSPDERDFMIETSVLGRLSGELCDTVTGRSGSSDVLRQLEQTNSFLIPLDRNGQWYRYHHLFEELLVAELHRRRPGDVAGLHARAYEWLRDHDDVVAAIGQAIDAGLRTDAADLLCGHWFSLMSLGRLATVRTLLARLDEDIEAYQPLTIVAAFAAGMAGEPAAARRLLKAAEEGTYDGPPPDGTESIESSLALARGSMALEGVDAALADGRLAYDLEPEGSPWHPLAALIVGVALMLRDEVDESMPYFREVGLDDPAMGAYALAELALAHLHQGEVDQATSTADTACAVLDAHGIEDLFVPATVQAARGLCALAVGDERTARVCLRAARRPMQAMGTAMPMDVMHTNVLLARIAIALDEPETAGEYVDTAQQIASLVGDVGVMAGHLAELQDRLASSAPADPDAPASADELTDREIQIVRLLPSGLTNAEIAEELFLSRNTIKTYLRRIYNKLGASSRAEAVLLGRERGVEMDDDGSPG